MELGFKIELVLADSLYGKSSQFIRKIAEYNLGYVVSIRSNHGVWLPSGQSVRANKWCQFKRTFSNQKSETRYIREIIYGKKRDVTYWEITVDFSNHPQWNHEYGWKNTLNNLRLIIQPLLLFWLIYPWLGIFPNSYLLLGFNHLIAAMNQFKPGYASG